MPNTNKQGKGKRSDRQGKGKRRASPKRSDEVMDEEDEAMSVASQNSLDFANGGDDTSAETNEDGTEEIVANIEQVLDDNLDAATQKSAKGRQMALATLQKTFRSRILSDYVANRKVTIQDTIERCLRRGTKEDRILAASLASLLCIQLGFGVDSEEVFRNLKPLLIIVIQDPTASPLARASCCTSLGLCCFIACDEEEDFLQCCNVFVEIFNTNKTVHAPQVPLHCNALLAWGLLLSISTNAEELATQYMTRVINILQTSNEIDLRITAGEILALMYEIKRFADDSFQGDKKRICEILKELATDNDRHKAKKELRQQRASFRDVSRAVEEGAVPEEAVRFGAEELQLFSWARRRQYYALKDALSTGNAKHLQGNDLLRQIFELGAPISREDVKQQKVSKFERQMWNNAASKARTLTRGKHRDKRNASMF